MTAGGPVALVAGATGPIGRAVVRALAADGARVAALSRSGDRVDGCVQALACDLGDPAALDAALSAVEAGSGPVEILVNAAHPPAGFGTPVAELDPGVLAAQLAGAAAHAALCARVVPGMRRLGRGRVVYVAGASMARPLPGAGGYAAAKAAGAALTRQLALEEGTAGITANVVAPGRVLDPESASEPSASAAALGQELARRLALPTFPSPDDVAAAVRLLVASPALTGQTLWVTGGEPITA
ncbi:SDR family NAD(P)-dependent oxidoreductase [Nocardioides nitrophenolicus]|uniref:SDR family NAD(P)-dependent oxidoreductase n=1 Tax=Nocardioides nitrophenolicus TaxID=60489 RepID=UPI001959027A|nr:SDR family oxidoreductase [Nocardioides nitrophenolicus]MBM7518576.1 NAD(P)-dependent dehydrogenase (short-subunit alcohol dehydrogenase family) [Nocardioides nitrophenolicus]